MAALEGQSGTLDLAEPCARCGRAIGGQPMASTCPHGGAVPQFYLFPTGNAFHGACLASEVMDLASPQQASKIQSIILRLSQVCIQLLRFALTKTLWDWLWLPKFGVTSTCA